MDRSGAWIRRHDGTLQASPKRQRLSPAARLRRWLGGHYAPYLYIAPFFVVFLSFFTYPVAYSFYVSLHRWNGVGPMRYVGSDNYTFVLGDSYWWSAVETTAVLWLMVIPVGTAISLLLALAWNRSVFLGRNLSQALFILPAVTSIVATSIVFRILYDGQFGPIDVLLRALHVPAVPWLTSDVWSKPAIAIVRLWESVGLFALFYSAALQGISTDIYDAAAVDGCGAIRRLWSITLPLLTRTILFTTMLGTLAVLGLFAEPQLITGGGPDGSSTNIGLYLYSLLQGLDFGTASAVSFLMTAIMIVVSVTIFVIARRWQFD